MSTGSRANPNTDSACRPQQRPTEGPTRKVNLAMKRAVDILLSAVGLVVLSPLFLMASILIKATSPGPVFFVQDRLGKDMKVFKIIKFRTMVEGAENKGDGLFVCSGNDSRVTRVGRVLRRTSIDELPQLINVLKGDMSLVGPRPPVTYHPYKPEGYAEAQKKRFAMRPGITGLAQVRLRASAPWDERFEIDKEYVDNFSVLLDIRLLVQTVLVAISGRNLYRTIREPIDNRANRGV